MGTGRISDVGVLTSVGVCNHRTAIAVTATAQKLAIVVGKPTIEILNIGSNAVYYGGVGVTSSNGFPIYRRAYKSWNNTKTGWKIYVVCAAGLTSELRIVEYD